MSRKVTRREFIGTAVGTTAVVASGCANREASAAPPARPNVLFILADDLGYGDLSCYGRPDYRTPVLDGLAKQGIKFMSAYAAAPVCTPTRCAFATGHRPLRVPRHLLEPALRGYEALAGPAALLTWDEARRVTVAMTTPQGTRGAEALGVTPRPLTGR